MHVVVLGAGLAGTLSAWYLRQEGHAVTVLDRQPGPGLETSFANGGQISVSHPEPWANPGAPLQLLKWLGREDAPLLFRPHADWRQWSWGLRFLLECLPWRSRRNTDAIARLSLYSRDCLRRLREDTGVEYDRLGRGILHLSFDRSSWAHAPARVAALQGYGMRAELRDAAACVALEPALADSPGLLGGVFAPDDETGDAYKFVAGIAQRAAQGGVAFLQERCIEGLAVHDGRIAGVDCLHGSERERIGGDAYLLALGSYSPLLAQRLGETLPIYPVKGYSITLPVLPDGAPQVSITDESRRIVCSRLGGRLRVAGTAELDGYNTALNRERCQAILRRTREIFPHLQPTAEPQLWTGLRPATPSNRPVIGRSRYANLFYNTGQGTLGWTLACGSARAAADIISGRRPAVDFPFRGV